MSLHLSSNPSSSDCVPSASLTQGGVRGDVLLPLVRAMGQVEPVMAAAQQDAAFLGCTASAKGFRRGSKAFLKQYFKYISGLNALDKPVSGGFQHILLGLTHFPFWFADVLKNGLTVQGSRSFNRVIDKSVLVQYYNEQRFLSHLLFNNNPCSKSNWLYKCMFIWRRPYFTL